MLRRASRRCYTKSSLQMMPEGPEVASLVEVMNTKYGILSYLFRRLLGYLFSFLGNNHWELLSTSFITGRYLTEPPTGWDELNKSLPKDVLSIQSKGKFIYFNLNNGTIWNTLG